MPCGAGSITRTHRNLELGHVEKIVWSKNSLGEDRAVFEKIETTAWSVGDTTWEGFHNWLD